MANDPTSQSIPPSSETSKTTSELNNLLQIISATNSLLQDAAQTPEEREKYMSMLRVSIERAENVAAELTTQSGGTSKKSAVHPSLAPFMRKKAAEGAPAPKQSVLLVDDEQMALVLMKRVLNDAGYEVVTAQSGFECLDHFRRRPNGFHIVLLDLTMPFMDGEETFRRLQELRSDIPVLLCTGFIQQERLDRLMTAGLAGFLRKPSAPEEIVSMVRNTLASVKYSGMVKSGSGISIVR